MGSDVGGREGGDKGGAKKDGASTDMPRDASDGRVSGLVFLFFLFFLSFFATTGIWAIEVQYKNTSSAFFFKS